MGCSVDWKNVVMDAEESIVRTGLLGGDGEIDGLQ
jgi:hypothetical protein